LHELGFFFGNFEELVRELGAFFLQVLEFPAVLPPPEDFKSGGVPDEFVIESHSEPKKVDGVLDVQGPVDKCQILESLETLSIEKMGINIRPCGRNARDFKFRSSNSFNFA